MSRTGLGSTAVSVVSVLSVLSARHWRKCSRCQAPRLLRPVVPRHARQLTRRDKADAEKAIATMNGEWLGSRAIRVNWANQKTQTGGSRSLMGIGGGSPGSAPGGAGSNGFQAGPLSFEQVAAQTPEYNTTVYVGNLIPYTTQADLIPLFQSFGYIVEVRMQADRGFAFVKLDTHQNAALAITSLQNQLVHGRPIKCSWGKDRQTDAPGFMVRTIRVTVGLCVWLTTDVPAQLPVLPGLRWHPGPAWCAARRARRQCVAGR